MTVAGVDGCRKGWIAVIGSENTAPAVRVFLSMADIIEALPDEAIVAVDMPIGLPELAGHGGRGPESLVRRVLGLRQSSVFSIPSRAAVYAETGPFGTEPDRYAAHRRACAVAQATSNPPRRVSIQAFGIFPKIRELDAFLVARPELRLRIVESHPEVAFWKLNGDREMQKPKKIKGRINPEGMEERRSVLASHGYERAFLERPPPRGASDDDFLDACAMALVAARVRDGVAASFPDPPLIDGRGIAIAIRA